MGVVYEAVDERLQRPVALKTLLPSSDDHVRERLLREARAAAAVNHPNICQLFEIGEHDGAPFLAMELLDGESLEDRLDRGALPLAEAIGTALSIVSALDALHKRSIVHRDLKPSNVFLSVHGVKLLDFGLARPVTVETDATALTRPGSLLGTPRYMSPEQARGEDVDERSDLFSVGSILFEMLSGRPAFNGPSAIEILHSVIHDHPPALTGSLAIVDADRVVQRALMKNPAERYTSAEAIAKDLRGCQARGDLSGEVIARATTRLMVLPFRILRPDPAIDFLAFSLADAITVSLSGLESLVVRSTLSASRYSDQPDFRTIASEAAVDAVVAGSLLHASGRVRVSVQLVEVPSGTVLWSHAWQVPLDDLFLVQDAVCSAIVEALALPLSSREQRLLHHDVPANSDAYAHYLRANRLSTISSSHWQLARESYERSLEADPSYAPAWARLGRCLRVMSKYGLEADAPEWRPKAEEAFQRAFRINPELSLAHNLYTYMEVESGRASHAVLRLLPLVAERSSDPELYAGLVQACRYVGLLDASIAAYQRAKRLDPSIRTSVAHSFFMSGDLERAIELDFDDPPYLTTAALLLLGRQEEALALCHAARQRTDHNTHLLLVLDGLIAFAEGRKQAGVDAIARLRAMPGFVDPEGDYYWAYCLAGLGETEGALELLARSVETGHSCLSALRLAPFQLLRDDPRFAAIVARVAERQEAAARAFEAADGPRLLGLTQPSSAQSA
jgi:eukaryotic-like serine/threonine-protein kinase